jgi:two-component system, LytTR family, response regulator
MNRVDSDDRAVRAMIVDDEPLGREIVNAMLQAEHQIEVIAECENGQQAITAINSLRPDLLFLDVQMPGIDGFGVVKEINKEKLPYIIFVTAYDQYAVKAFEINALDYLLKPIDPDRFANSIERALKMIREKQESAISRRILSLLNNQRDQQPEYLERIAIKKEGKILFVRVNEIEWIVAEGNYVSLHLTKKSHMLRTPISVLETKLNPNRFQRINRSTIVNIDFIKELVPMMRGEHQVIMQDGTDLKLSVKFRDNLTRYLGGTF